MRNESINRGNKLTNSATIDGVRGLGGNDKRDVKMQKIIGSGSRRNKRRSKPSNNKKVQSKNIVKKKIKMSNV